MTVSTGIMRIDVHGLRTWEAVNAVTNLIYRANRSIYRIKVIHGYHRGTRLREALIDEYSYGREEMVKRIEMGSNEGETDLILREYY